MEWHLELLLTEQKGRKPAVQFYNFWLSVTQLSLPTQNLSINFNKWKAGH